MLFPGGANSVDADAAPEDLVRADRLAGEGRFIDFSVFFHSIFFLCDQNRRVAMQKVNIRYKRLAPRAHEYVFLPPFFLLTSNLNL